MADLRYPIRRLVSIKALWIQPAPTFLPPPLSPSSVRLRQAALPPPPHNFSLPLSLPSFPPSEERCFLIYSSDRRLGGRKDTGEFTSFFLSCGRKRMPLARYTRSHPRIRTLSPCYRPSNTVQLLGEQADVFCQLALSEKAAIELLYIL